jgi:hypothetical protein
MAAGTKNTHCTGKFRARYFDQSKAKYSPREMRMPKMPPKVPRSRR